MANTCKYYKQQKYVSYNSGVTWSPLQEFRKGELYESQSADCDGGITLYRWFEMSSASTYWCDSVDKWTKDVYQQSIDNGQTWTDVTPAQYRKGQTLLERNSEDCGYIAPQYRWYPSGYTCDGYDKWEQSIYQVSYDSGSTWQNVVPTQYSATTFIEHNSEYCGYEPPTPSYDERWIDGWICDDCTVKKYINMTSGGTVYSAECNSSSTITVNDVTNRGQITSSTIGSCVTSIGNGAYSGCNNLYIISIPSSVESIGDSAFSGCTMLMECGIPDSVKTIGSNAFNGCVQMAYINLPNELTSIGASAFANCANFNTINIPNTLSTIPSNCFNNCDGLSDIEIPSSVTSIGESAFANCNGLYYAVIYATTPPALGNNAFNNVNSEFKILVPSESVNAYKAAWSNYADKIYAI